MSMVNLEMVITCQQYPVNGESRNCNYSKVFLIDVYSLEYLEDFELYWHWANFWGTFVIS